jgi:hypothetical protein
MRAIACSILFLANVLDCHFTDASHSDAGAVSALLAATCFVAAIVFLFKDKPRP